MMKTTWIAAAAILSMTAVLPASAGMRQLASGQTLSLPLNDQTDGPVLKLVVSRAALDGYKGESDGLEGESYAERRARAHQVVLDTPEGRDLVSFLHLMAKELGNRYAAVTPLAGPTVTIALDEKLQLDGSNMMGDALKDGFTLGLAASATTPVNFVSHMEVTEAGPSGAKQTFVCETRTPGRPPKYPRKHDPHFRDEYTRMYDVGRRACLTQILDQMGPPSRAGGRSVGS
jgi:hypothetical protein